MFNSKCGCSKCSPMFIGKILLIVGGLNWGILGVSMLMSKNWNVVHMVLNSMPTLEAIVYVLVGISAIMKIFGCKCAKCASACGTCGTEVANKSV